MSRWIRVRKRKSTDIYTHKWVIREPTVKKDNIKITQEVFEKSLEEEKEQLDNGKYSLDSMLGSLFSDITDEAIIEDYKPTNKGSLGKIVYTSIDERVSKDTRIPAGHYFSIASNLVSDDAKFDRIRGKVPRNLYESMWVGLPLFRVDIKEKHFSQDELIQRLATNELDIVDMTDKYKMSYVTSLEEVTCLEIVEEKYFNERIEEILLKYDDIVEPDKLLKRFIEYKKEVSDNRRMVFCPLLNTKVLTLGEDIR